MAEQGVTESLWSPSARAAWSVSADNKFSVSFCGESSDIWLNLGKSFCLRAKWGMGKKM